MLAFDFFTNSIELIKYAKSLAMFVACHMISIMMMKKLMADFDDDDVDDYDEWLPNGRHTNAGVRIMVVGMWVNTYSSQLLNCFIDPPSNGLICPSVHLLLLANSTLVAYIKTLY